MMTLTVDGFTPTTSRARQFLASSDKKLLIGGAWHSAADGASFDAIDPASGKRLAQLARGGKVDIDRAVAAARDAFENGPWRSLTPAARGKLLLRLADLMEAEIDALAEIETLDQGKPLFVGRWAEIPGAVEQFRFFAGQASRIEGHTITPSITYQPPGKQLFAYTKKEPIGVVGAIVPWNSPLVLTAMKLAPALAAGCTIVLKPAEDTSLSALLLGEMFEAAGFPPGVLNIVTGLGAEAGRALAAHPDVDKIAFTGSTATGRDIIDAAKGNLKQVSLELGGKSPVIVMDDADLSLAVPGAANAIFFNGGQVCVAGSRLYAQSKIYDRLIEGIAAAAQKITLGHGLDPETQMGPLVSARHAERVAGFIARGRESGASLVTGGERMGPIDSFIQPTILAEVSDQMEVVREEIFGPVLVVQRFDDPADVITRANDSPYGLAASVWTESLSTAHRLAGALRVGTVWINAHSFYDATLPIGGVKQSGWGRDSGQGAVDNYLSLKTICAVL